MIEPLSDAIQARDTATVQRLLDDNPGLVNAQSEHTDLPLVNAAKMDNVDMVRLLLDKGADVNPEMTKPFMLPINCAAIYGDVPMLTLLLDRGANPNTTMSYIPSPLFMAVTCTPPNAAAVKLLLDRGADVKADTSPGQTALAAAQAPLPYDCPDIVESLKQREEIIRLLKQAGATK